MTAAPYPDFDGRAHCRLPGVDVDRFHPSKGGDPSAYAVTKKLCTGGGKVPACPFLDGCREYGITHSIAGIWGGLGEKERAAIRQARRIVPEPLSMGVIAAVDNSRERGRADWCALKPCPDCGKEMHPKAIRRHLREVHRRAAA